jgi:hypothetical protein
MIFDGVLYKEIPEITQRLLLKGIGAASIDVEPFFLCGQGALAYALGQMPRPTQLEDGDYDFVTGLGIESQYGMAKIAKAPLSAGAGATVGLSRRLGHGHRLRLRRCQRLTAGSRLAPALLSLPSTRKGDRQWLIVWHIPSLRWVTRALPEP